MLFFLGLALVIGTIVVSYSFSNLSLWLLLQPQEWGVLIGVSIGSFIISNPAYLLKETLKAIPKAMKHSRTYQKDDYLSLLIFLFNFFRTNNINDLVKLEEQIENPNTSPIFVNHPILLQKSEAMEFFRDSMRLITIGLQDSYKLEEIMQSKLDEYLKNKMKIAQAVLTLGDNFPAIGILAAVMGVIMALAAITASPEVMGVKVAGALVGTLAGVLLSYGLITPIGTFLENFYLSEVTFLECIKKGIMSYAQGLSPSIAVEASRQSIPSDLHISFEELEIGIEMSKKNH